MKGGDPTKAGWGRVGRNLFRVCVCIQVSLLPTGFLLGWKLSVKAVH